ncbi:hypothetical protein HanLR1_Chr05g0162511 [Helianthus annuus]|nr:hypothetical protein HanHA89_Chr05g0172241 [Helianthus annuus]KAJ0748790.1 hypothetical protein HanLR1_Chr05g0162511 [Helianthus annuus]
MRSWEWATRLSTNAQVSTLEDKTVAPNTASPNSAIVCSTSPRCPVRYRLLSMPLGTPVVNTPAPPWS